MRSSAIDLFGGDWRDLWSGAEIADSVGAVFTKPEIVDLILDLAGYTPDRPLIDKRLLEPSCGDGAFLNAIISRLLEAVSRSFGEPDWNDSRLNQVIRAVDIDVVAVESARASSTALLVAEGCPRERALELSTLWIVNTDFLLENWNGSFDFVVGNPPYVRIEHLPRPVLCRYRELYETTSDRADVYVAFIEQGLRLLSVEGVLAFICANRFTKNKYGSAIRRFISRSFRVRHYLNLEHTQPFLSDVSAYPAIFVIDRGVGGSTLAGNIGDISPEGLQALRTDIENARPTTVSRFDEWYSGDEPWTATSASVHVKMSDFRDRFPTIEESGQGTRVGIGVATGADAVFVLKGRSPSIEESRQIPLVISRDIAVKGIDWSGRYLVNPFSDNDDGSLVALSEFPMFTAYMNAHADRLKGRHVAKSRSGAWYRTIDRIWPALQRTPKLLIPDIQSGAVIGLDHGLYYPHHNLYWITSDSWPLVALQAILRSSIATQQVRALSVEMRGGSIRYQAQTLRRVRVPSLSGLTDVMLEQLASIAHNPWSEEAEAVVTEAYYG